MRKIIFLLGLAPLVLLAAGAAWRLYRPPSPADRTLTVQIGDKRLRFASSYVRATESAAPDRVDLVARAPDFAPAAAAPSRLPATGQDDDGKGRAQVFLTLIPAPKFEGRAAVAAPAERYGPHIAAEAQMMEGGLLRRRFDDKSPYAGEDLYLAPPDGEEFFARCLRQRLPADGLPSTCLSELRIEGMLLQMRFDPVWLGEWRQMRTTALQLARAALAP